MKVLFIASGKSGGAVSPIVKFQGESLQKTAGVEIEYFPVILKGFKGYLRTIFILRKHIKGKGFDILHAHYGLTAIITLLARRNEKLVVSFMGDDIVGSNRQDGSVTLKSRVLASINAWLATRFYDHSIVKSAEMLDHIDCRNVSLIPNGVDLSVFRQLSREESRRELGLESDHKVVIFVSDPGRVEKNFSLASEAVSKLKKQNLILIPVYGLDRDKVNLYYNAADVLVLSSFHEGSPNVIKEALACGTPIVSTRVGDVEWLTRNIEGCFLSGNKVPEFSEAISKALQFSSVMGKTEGRKRIEELKLDSESIAKKIYSIYLNTCR